MSRSSADLILGIAPGAIAFTSGKAREIVRGDPRDPVRLLPQLEAALKNHRAKHVRAVFSHKLVRHALTTAPGKALSLSEEAALARARLIEIHGEEAAGLRVRAMSQPPSYGLLGAGLDEGLCSALESLAQRRSWSLTLHPLAAALPALRSAAQADAWIVAEPGWATLFYGKPGRVLQVASQAIGDDWRDTLPEWLARADDRVGEAAKSAKTKSGPRSVVVQTVGLASGTPPALDGWRWQLAQSAVGEADAQALAMGAA